MASFQDRVIGAMWLRAATFEDVEHDASATSQAAIVVLAASVARGIGASYDIGVRGLLFSIVTSAVAWVVGAAVLWIVGTRVLPGKNTEADFGQLLRTVGFAQAPAMFAVLGVLPLPGPLLAFLASVVWVLLATVIAVRQALDYDDIVRAVIVCVMAWFAYVVVTLIASLLGFGARVF